jgi:hypothetical protein
LSRNSTKRAVQKYRKPSFGKQRKIRVATRRLMKKRLIENPSLMLPN